MSVSAHLCDGGVVFDSIVQCLSLLVGQQRRPFPSLQQQWTRPRHSTHRRPRPPAHAAHEKRKGASGLCPRLDPRKGRGQRSGTGAEGRSGTGAPRCSRPTRHRPQADKGPTLKVRWTHPMMAFSLFLCSRRLASAMASSWLTCTQTGINQSVSSLTPIGHRRLRYSAYRV